MTVSIGPRIVGRLALIFLVAALPLQGAAADKIPTTIAAFSTPALASDKFYQDMGAYIAEAPGEPFDVKLLTRGELGSDEAHFYALRRGRIQIAGVGFQSVATAVPELTILNAAYLLESWAEVDFVYETAVVPFINALLADHGVVGLRLFGAAWHGLYAKTPIYLPADAAGRRFRALIDPASQLFVRALGADTFQVASTEVVTALQTGLIEAGETNSHVYNMTGTSIDAPYFTRTRNTPTVIAILANKKWFDELSPDQQQRVTESHPSMLESGIALRADEERMLVESAASHVTIIEPNVEQLAVWRAVGQSTHQALIDRVGGRAQELYDMVQKAKSDFRLLNAAD
ncbi:MAG: hypothetical protein GKS03_09815 [Alphaproteobacteria bacterium]|nr:hypothetical protein [Alphaproteobacteria bacterium]